jgi:hypothetical protein
MKPKKEFKDLKQGSMSVSEYVTRFTQLSRYALDNMDTNEKKQDWFLNGLNDGLAYALEARDFVNFQDMVDKALVLENRRGIMERRRKMQRTESQGSNTRFYVGSSTRGPVFRPVQHNGPVFRPVKQNGQPRISNASATDSTPQLPTRSARRHRRGAIMHKTLVLWDRVLVVVRVGTTLIGVQGSRQIKRQPQAQIRTSTVVPTTMHPLWQGRTKLMPV